MARLHSPAVSHTTTSLLWAIGFGFFIMIGGLALGWSRAAAFVIALVAGFGIFVYVRVYGEDEPRRP
jgi:hypothetical protein